MAFCLNLRPRREARNLHVKIHRYWDVNPRGRLMSVNIVFVDKKGDKIHGVITDPDAIRKHRKYLKEGEVVHISKFIVGPSIGQFRPTKNAYRININFGTRFESVGENFPSAQFDFVNFEEIGEDEKLEDNLKVSFISYLYLISDVGMLVVSSMNDNS
ncbi:hypothetical protein RIF29_21104 [Crotalaria pallida]|uniref:Replication protein A 70 kDa DNA-binding subunit B/D first OB fold domain-containing protein n=1 Tax=Crotalaria pallida TaxID=3830 RepID=A0AAN9ID32_CROPI